ncbi:MAG: hypothetical protein ACKVU4_01685 [Phycisphaerales bacterium]
MRLGRTAGWRLVGCVCIGVGCGAVVARGQASDPVSPSTPPVEPQTTEAGATAPAVVPIDPPEGDAGQPETAAEPAAPLPAEEPEGVLWLRDGRRITGFIVAPPEEGEGEGGGGGGVTLRIGGLPTKFAADIVDRVEILPPLLERYRAMREAIDGRDPDDLVRIAEWLLARKQYTLAVEELERAVAVRPGHAPASSLLLIARGQRDLAARAGVGGGAPADRAGTPGGARRPARRAFPTLTPEQINIIKVYEIDLASRPAPRLVIPRETMVEVFEEHAGSGYVPANAEAREEILRWTPSKQLELMFRLQARDHYGDVKVIGNPPVMERFRDGIHRTWLINSCATTKCHGGEEAGRLFLGTHRPNSDPSVYTNFLILERFKLTDGTPLIDHDEPQRSPLLQMALPRKDSIRPHPVVPGATGADVWRPTLRNTDDPRFVDAIAWIKSLYRPRPEYPIDYQPPSAVGAEAALPATKPEAGR